jgi:hypothetical protein
MLGLSYRTVLQQMPKMSITFSKTRIRLFFGIVLCDFAKCFWVNVGSSMFSIMFQFLQASWVIPINSFFDKFSNVTGEVERVYYMRGGPASDFIFVP